MLFRILHDEVSGKLTYLLADADGREAVLVDPRSRDLPVLQALLGEHALRLRWVLCTHALGAQQSGDVGRLAVLGAPLVQGIDGPGRLRPADGAELRLGGGCVRVLHTPGQTPDGLSFLWRDRVFCGDLLAVDAGAPQPGPTDAAALWDSVTRRIFTLPDETLLYAGHDPRARAVSTVMEQRRWHPLFSQLTRDAFLARMWAVQNASRTVPPPDTRSSAPTRVSGA